MMPIFFTSQSSFSRQLTAAIVLVNIILSALVHSSPPQQPASRNPGSARPARGW
jgi:hypothetical protein